MIQKIRYKSFSIQDPDIIDFMRINQIRHLKLNMNTDDGVYVSVEYPDYENLLSFEKGWFNVHWGKRVVSIRNPSIFKDHIGKEVEVYREKIFRKNHEVFRIKPIGFDLIKILKERKRRIKIDVPYFSKSGYCIIPKKYINDKDIVSIFGSKLSFNRLDHYLVENGLIFARITKDDEPGSLSYPLRECSNGFCTRPLKGVVEMVSDHGKKITNFQYIDTTYDKSYKYDLIIFKEVNIDGS